MVHDTYGFYSKIINEIGNLSVLLLRLTVDSKMHARTTNFGYKVYRRFLNFGI